MTARKAVAPGRQYATPVEEIGVRDGEVLPPFDLDADALEVEASGAATVQIKVGGRVIDFPVMSEWPMCAVDKVTQKRVVIDGQEQMLPADMLGAITDLFPGDPATVDLFRALPLRKVQRLVEYIVEVSGVGPGESSRSGRPSGSTRLR